MKWKFSTFCGLSGTTDKEIFNVKNNQSKISNTVFYAMYLFRLNPRSIKYVTICFANNEFIKKSGLDYVEPGHLTMLKENVIYTQ